MNSLISKNSLLIYNNQRILNLSKTINFFNYLYTCTCRYNNRKVLTLSVTKKNNNQGIQNVTNKLH